MLAILAVLGLGGGAVFAFTFVCCIGVAAVPRSDPGITYRSDPLPTAPPKIRYPAVPTCENPSRLARRDLGGSARDLVGEQLTVVAFAEVEGGSPWTGADRVRALHTLDQAHRWLEAEAARHGHSLSLRTKVLAERARFRPDAVPEYDGPFPGEELRDIDVALRGSASRFTWRHDFFAKERVDGAHLLVMIRAKGRSFAYSYITGSELWLDPSFLYVGHPKGPEWEVAVIAHEILHNYGADDLYVERTHRSTSTTLTPEVFPEVETRWPESIMIQTASHPARIDKYVDPFNAWQVGWHACPEERFYRRILDNQL